ncbi:MAG: cbb3-type cytochrome c oxidase subunit 3 [Rhodospirillaceae bacterium]|nr:cbb3-type cytochrome c oxidase subunit 3 [Rhodospirillaceae bacterium]MXW90677.1 cbb3-type cytochrome c oxidase subunit 3 [Rhodospirillaceae bacterium]MYB11970.1 cbb3-type cytochrome c oxidase subunit 3 [Rhodospirillaceae bacterium]MYG51902.1 cbb3-type cytochrome c oxidase subunit 3 [Rhodospirillaceae bacterium]MYI50127.1 cbb3-type cytochrome c oxidase subunit 3 [Rhodospirillaceae bacterium]
MEDFTAFFRSAWVVWMMALFVGIVVWVLWPSNRERFRRAARIPLSEDERPADSADSGARTEPAAAAKDGA